uniref:Uncharacterized protein n=1 Tax=Babesia bovis TaxID=5865 RepID=S6B0I2_BABBO|nr:hypothetical protein [Babesia bovis]
MQRCHQLQSTYTQKNCTHRAYSKTHLECDLINYGITLPESYTLSEMKRYGRHQSKKPCQAAI